MFSFSFWCTLSTGWFGVLELVLVLLVIVVGVLVGVVSILVVVVLLFGCEAFTNRIQLFVVLCIKLFFVFNWLT